MDEAKKKGTKETNPLQFDENKDWCIFTLVF